MTLRGGEELKKEAGRWLEKAKQDLDDGRFNIQGGRKNLGVFMFQQSVEKALKALHIEKYGKYEFTHNLVRLASDLDMPEKFQRTFEELTPIYTGFRYPDVAEGEIEDIEEILANVEEIMEWIEKRLTE